MRTANSSPANLVFLVFRMDPGRASGTGICSTWAAYRRLGVGEFTDIQTAIRWLTAHSLVDAGRIGMTGHSYGGFMTAYALTHSKLFAAGVAGAPVTDWHNYDAFYTEHYMNMPQENPDGYKKRPSWKRRRTCTADCCSSTASATIMFTYKTRCNWLMRYSAPTRISS